MSLLKRLAKLYSFDCFILNASSVDDAKNEIMLAWGDTGGSILYLVSDEKKEFFPKLSNCSWLIVVLSEYHNLFFANDESLRVLFGLGYIILGFLGISSFFFFFLISNKKFIKKSGKNYVQKGCYKKCIPPLHLKRT